MTDFKTIRSVSFDTSFLLNEDPLVDQVIHALASDQIPCYVTATVASELEQLKIWGRISPAVHKKAMKRILSSKATLIDFKNRLLSDAFGQGCIASMTDHGFNTQHIVNDCSILITGLKNGVDLFLSEDFHFRSAITKEIISGIQYTACQEYHLMCDTTLLAVDARTFQKTYHHGAIDLTAIGHR
jgi:hypothetical protein